MAESTDARISFVLAVGELTLKYGVPAAAKIIKAWKVEDPTVEDIQALRGMKPATDYFEKETS